MSDCIFCRILAKQIPSTIVYEDDHVIAFDDIHPQAPTHVLIVPQQHIPTINDITPTDHALIAHMVQVAQKIAVERNIAESGYRLVWNCNPDSGQEVYHIHLHLLGGRVFNWPPG